MFEEGFNKSSSSYMHDVFLSLGSNMGDRLRYIKDAIKALRDTSQIIAISPVYETSPYGYVKQSYFLNCAVHIKTNSSPSTLLKDIHEIEKFLGRKREIRWGPRTIDIDIIFYDTLILNTPELMIPHPDMQNRLFVLKPLADIAPQIVHPILKKSIKELLDSLHSKDTCELYEVI